MGTVTNGETVHPGRSHGRHPMAEEPATTNGDTMFDHDYPAYNAWELVRDMGGMLTVRVSKVGGGTIGRAYGNGEYWHYLMQDHGTGRVWRGSDYVSGSPMTHLDVANDLTSYACEE
jgi:hypothetical protein